jgi:signal transduction histidine kinase
LGSLESHKNPDLQEKILERIRRNLKRLEDIQLEVEDIVKQREFEENYEVSPWLQQTLDFVDLLEEDDTIPEEALQSLRSKIEDFFTVKKSNIQDLKIKEHILKVVESARLLSKHRAVTLITNLDFDPTIRIDPDVLEKSIMSLLKNAIENTPDGGEILIALYSQPGTVEVEIKDTGVGITEDSQKYIFGGFYHSKATDIYSTKKPFDFGAGGKGLDLLRLKIFAETYHFRIEFNSTRCRYIPSEKDLCPGDIAECDHVQNFAECAQSGGTAFKLIFKVNNER